MAVGVDTDLINQYKNSRNTTEYPKINLQSGKKEQASFYVKPLQRIVVASKECNAPFFEYYMHYGLGPDGDQKLVCLNTNREELKLNTKKCPACSGSRKVLRNSDDYDDKQIERAKKQSAKIRIN